MGGLGNQMFQYAFGRALAARRSAELKFDVSGFVTDLPKREYDLSIFELEADFASEDEVFEYKRRFRNRFVDKVANRLLGVKPTYIIEPHFNFSQDIYDTPDNAYLHGYWQTEKYFSDIKETIRKEFTFREELSPAAAELIKRIHDSNSVCVNVRRGDFVTNSFHGSYGVDYFRKAESILRERIGSSEYFIFSDEIDWCESNLQFDGSTTFVSHEYAGPKFQHYLQLMAACKHYIIPNSSFAWWAVWFNRDRNKTVIAPKMWFNDPRIDTSDLTPKDWIRT